MIAWELASQLSGVLFLLIILLVRRRRRRPRSVVERQEIERIADFYVYMIVA